MLSRGFQRCSSFFPSSFLNFGTARRDERLLKMGLPFTYTQTRWFRAYWIL